MFELITKEMQKNPYNTPFEIAIREAWEKKNEKIRELSKQIEENYWVCSCNFEDIKGKTAIEYLQSKNAIERCRRERERLKAEAVGLHEAMEICIKVVDELGWVK